MEVASVRIDSSLLNENQGKVVRIIGKCESYDPSSSTATFISGGPINLNLTTGESLNVNSKYEVIGKVGASDQNVSVYSVIELSDNINLEVAEKLVKYVHKVPELFH
ncbi:uncharacterized protein PRCAT00005294001 [Priceomyces carsonii]|uniref:uncharacterized protein n=1 Tax=Priceomyces carsonii TaxID=28549 RepID=UPI002ED85306|nr:unnamed protein product [Priceomyces carsonii]